MSLGYADRLSHREDLGGQLGAPELHSSPKRVLQGVEQLAELIQKAARVAAFTGAGISTACGIPDFRGPHGIWTLRRAGLEPPLMQTSFVYAKPSLTHMALLGLMQSGKLTYICSQNVDGLHLRSGVPRNQLAELHGDCFAERCEKCACEYVRDFEMETVGFKRTGRMCTQPGCAGHLRDHILDWEDGLPDDELEASEQHASAADVSLCLGTSLQIYPAANLPLRTLRSGGSMAIINLQATPKDARATLVLHAKVDTVMALLMHKLQLPIPVYIRTDRALVSHTISHPGSSTGSQGQEQGPGHQQQNGTTAHAAGSSGGGGADGRSTWGFSLHICSPHGQQCPLPMLERIDVTFPGSQLLPEMRRGHGPFVIERQVGQEGVSEVTAHVALFLVEAADPDKRLVRFDYTIQQSAPEGSLPVSFITQQQDYAQQQQQLVAQLAEAAAQQAEGAGDDDPPPQKKRAGRPRGKSKTATKYEETELESGLEPEGGVSGSGRQRKKAKRLDL